MEKYKTLKLVTRVAKVFDSFDGPNSSNLFWRTDEEFAPITFFARCDDLFWWAVADLEQITLDNIHILEKSLDDLLRINKNSGHYAHLLFCCRMRKMRPQGAYYQYIPSDIWPLFN